MKLDKNTSYVFFKRLSKEEQDKIRRMYMIYGDDSKILVDKYGRPWRYVHACHSYFPIKKEYVYGNEKAYNRDTK